MDLATFEALRTSMKAMHKTLTNLRKDMQDQHEAHRNEIAALHHHIMEVHKEQTARQHTPSPLLKDVEESQVGGRPLKRTKVDLGGSSRVNRGTSIPAIEERQDQPRLMAEPETNAKNLQNPDDNQHKQSKTTIDIIVEERPQPMMVTCADRGQRELYKRIPGMEPREAVTVSREVNQEFSF